MKSKPHNTKELIRINITCLKTGEILEDYSFNRETFKSSLATVQKEIIDRWDEKVLGKTT